MGKNSVADGISLVFLSDLDCIAGVQTDGGSDERMCCWLLD